MLYLLSVYKFFGRHAAVLKINKTIGYPKKTCYYSYCDNFRSKLTFTIRLKRLTSQPIFRIHTLHFDL